MLEAAPADAVNPPLALFRITGPQVVKGSLSPAVIVFPKQSSEKTSGIKIGIYIEKMHNSDNSAQGRVCRKVLDGTLFLVLIL